MRRYRRQGCGHVWRQDASQVAQARSKASRAGVHWDLEALVCQHLSLPWITQALPVPGTPLTLRSWKRAGAC